MVSSQSDVKYREGCDPSDNYSNELHVSPDLAPLEPLLEGPPGRRRTRRGGPSGNRRSVGREVLRLFVYGLIIMTIGGAAFASQYGDENSKRNAWNFAKIRERTFTCPWRKSVCQSPWRIFEEFGSGFDAR